MIRLSIRFIALLMSLGALLAACFIGPGKAHAMVNPYLQKLVEAGFTIEDPALAVQNGKDICDQLAIIPAADMPAEVDRQFSDMDYAHSVIWVTVTVDNLCPWRDTSRTGYHVPPGKVISTFGRQGIGNRIGR